MLLHTHILHVNIHATRTGKVREHAQSHTHAHTSTHTAPKGINTHTCTHNPNPLVHVPAVLYMFLAYFDAICFLLRTYYALTHFYVYNIYIHMHTCIIASYPLARAQVVIYIFDIGWLTVISFFLTRTYMSTRSEFLPTHTARHTHTHVHVYTRMHAPLRAHEHTCILCVSIHPHTQAWRETEHAR